jgi:hypothetical protein
VKARVRVRVRVSLVPILVVGLVLLCVSVLLGVLSLYICLYIRLFYVHLSISSFRKFFLPFHFVLQKILFGLSFPVGLSLGCGGLVLV